MPTKTALTRAQSTAIARKFVAHIEANGDMPWTPDLLISFLPMELRDRACEKIEQSDCHPVSVGAIAATVYGLGRS